MKKNISQLTKSNSITMITAYDYPTAYIADQSGIDTILVGDSVGVTVLGYDSVSMVTMKDMIHHLSAVRRAVESALIIADMPIGSYKSPEIALKNAKRFMKYGADAIKMEGGQEIIKQVKILIKNQIPVCGHLGYLPQSGQQPSVIGKSLSSAQKLILDALCLQKAGAFMIVLELVPIELAKIITNMLHIPTIGIGAGPYCDGQVQVFHDIMGLSPKLYKHSKLYFKGNIALINAIKKYIKDVKNKKFPTIKNASNIDKKVVIQIKNWLKAKNLSKKASY